jgi:hypothetical protein
MRTRILSAILAMTTLALCGCSRGPVNGYFVSRGLPHQLVMAHLVESPPGVLSGAIEAVALNQNGSNANVRDYNVEGSITKGNVSLRIMGAIATIAGWFGGAPVLVGKLKGGRLTLSHAADTLTLWSTSQGAYLADVRSLDQEQAALDQFNDAVRGLKSAVVYSQTVDAALDHYHAWGEQRISRRAQANAWWAARIRGYSAIPAAWTASNHWHREACQAGDGSNACWRSTRTRITAIRA